MNDRKNPPETGTVSKLPDDIEAAYQRIESLSRVMDSIVAIPGTKVRIGADALLGLVPVVGDVISQGISAYLIWEARKLGVSRFTMARMLGNSLVDTMIGAVPVAGDLFDVAFRANMKNLRLLRRHLEKNHARSVAQPDALEVEYKRVA
jgi:Domain of unknown function (DUF4112)